MIRQVELQDAKAITDIHNEYVQHSVATFDTEPVQEEEMRVRIAEISSRFPYFIYEEGKEIAGYCYAHTWKERSAYRYTLETTFYLSPGHTGKGIGMLPDAKADRSMSRKWLPRPDCLHHGRERSQ